MYSCSFSIPIKLTPHLIAALPVEPDPINGSNVVPFGGGDDGRFGTTTMSQDGVSGRFPANIIFDEEAGQLLDEQSGKSKTKANKNYKHSNTETESNTFTGRGTYTPREDEGGARKKFSGKDQKPKKYRGQGR